MLQLKKNKTNLSSNFYVNVNVIQIHYNDASSALSLYVLIFPLHSRVSSLNQIGIYVVCNICSFTDICLSIINVRIVSA